MLEIDERVCGSSGQGGGECEGVGGGGAGYSGGGVGGGCDAWTVPAGGGLGCDDWMAGGGGGEVEVKWGLEDVSV